MQVRKLTQDEYEKIITSITVDVPIEQLPIWHQFESTIPGRSSWGFAALHSDDNELLAILSFIQFETHGYKYLRARHAPVWIVEPSKNQEQEALDAITSFVRSEDKHQVFLRLAVKQKLPSTHPCLSTLPYDTTVYMDLTGGEDAILSRMKPRGRRDVRKALRECPAVFEDETAQASASFAEYHSIMLETAQRDGFIAADCSFFENMINILGPEHCRVYAARVDGKLVAWSLATISGRVATRYYAATVSGIGRLHVADALVLFESLHVAELGCTLYDLMGIGSEFAPETMNLNEFKTKFAKEGTVDIAPDRDVPLKKQFYFTLVQIKKLRARLRGSIG